MNKRPFISICIPTYNRSNSVSKLVNNILKCQSNEIEIIVLDNCSTDDTILLLEKIDDPRFSFIANETNIGGPLNQLKALTCANGVYALLCLDKDYIIHENISKLIGHLKNNETVVFGHCSLNSQEEHPDTLYDKGFSSVVHMSFLGAHPTGMYYKSEIYKQSTILKRTFREMNSFAFYPDLINAEMSFHGKSLLINLPVFFTESKKDCAELPSFTYNSSNLYFEPKGRLNEYKIYMNSVCELNLLKKEKIKLIGLLYYKGLSASTLVYKSILNDHLICMHHGIETRKVGLKELVRIDWKYSSFFFMEDLSISWRRKFLIFTYTHLRIAFNLIKNTIRGVI